MRRHTGRPGRPPKSQAQRERDAIRRIPLSKEGRMRFIPGRTHALDTEFDEALRLRDEMIERMNHMKQQIEWLNVYDDPLTQIQAEEKALKQFLWMHYKHLKHRDHIIAVFISIRRRRALARLQAASVALEMANELLEADYSILNELRAAVDFQRELEAIIDTKRKPGHAAFKVRGTTKEDVQAQIQEFESQAREQATEAKQRIDHRHVYGDAQTTKLQLEEFDRKVLQVRGAMMMGIGYFVDTWVKRWRYTPEARKCLAKGIPFPEGMQIWEGQIYGPYTHMQWKEHSMPDSAYTLQMGRIPSAKWKQAKEPEFDQEETPWPDL